MKNYSITCGLPSLQSIRESKATICIKCMVIALGILVILVGIHAIKNVSYTKALGSTTGYALIPIGTLFILVSLTIKCIKKTSLPQQTDLDLRASPSQEEIIATQTQESSIKAHTTNPWILSAEEASTLKYISKDARIPNSCIGQELISAFEFMNRGMFQDIFFSSNYQNLTAPSIEHTALHFLQNMVQDHSPLLDIIESYEQDDSIEKSHIPTLRALVARTKKALENIQ